VIGRLSILLRNAFGVAARPTFVGLAMIAAVLAVACASSAYADDQTSLSQARRDVESSDYMAARSDLVSALNAGTADPDQLAEIYKLTGIVEAALGDTAKATAAFERWIALDPKAELPPGTSPKITRPFDSAAKAKPGKVQLKPETSASPPHLTVVIERDPLRLVARARVFVSVDGKGEIKLEAASRGQAKIDVDLPHGNRLDIRVEALDEHGNRVATLGSHDVTIVITGAVDEARVDLTPKTVAEHHEEHATPDDQPRADTAEGRPVVFKWWLWGAIAVAAGGFATYEGLQSRSDADALNKLNANSPSHNFSEAQTLQKRVDHEALLFNIGIATAGALAIGSCILFLTEPRAHGDTTVGAAPTRGGASVVLERRF
jgi:hypothetical protein